jgi:hypothetical protein
MLQDMGARKMLPLGASFWGEEGSTTLYKERKKYKIRFPWPKDCFKTSPAGYIASFWPNGAIKPLRDDRKPLNIEF